MQFTKLGMVIAAGGSGSRFSKTRNKLLVDFRGKPLLVHALATFLPVLEPGNMVIAAPAGELENMRNTVNKHLPGNQIKWVIGGATRLSSVANAVAALPQELELVAIHDAARPLATVELLEKLCCAAEICGGAIPGAPPVDTVKVIDNKGFIAQNLIRSDLAAVATPQVFRFQEYLRALSLLDKNLLAGVVESSVITDDAALFTQAGGKVQVIFSNEPNFKVTLPGDI